MGSSWGCGSDAHLQISLNLIPGRTLQDIAKLSKQWTLSGLIEATKNLQPIYPGALDHLRHFWKIICYHHWEPKQRQGSKPKKNSKKIVSRHVFLKKNTTSLFFGTLINVTSNRPNNDRCVPLESPRRHVSHTCIDHKEHFRLLVGFQCFAWQILAGPGGRRKIGWLATGRWSLCFFCGKGWTGVEYINFRRTFCVAWSGIPKIG